MRMQEWSEVISLWQYATTFCRPVMTKRDLWLSWFEGMKSSLYWKTFRFILLMILTQVSWGCAFSFEKKFTLKEKTSLLVQVSLYLKECLQNIQNPNKLSGTKRIQNNIYITTHQFIHRSHTLSSMSLPGINDSNEQSLNCNFISWENFSCIASSKSVTELLCLMIRSNSFSPSPALCNVLPNDWMANHRDESLLH